MLPDSPSLLHLLHCPLCSPPAILRAPLTLRCGHSLCASHFSPHSLPSSSNKSSTAPPLLPPCPLPTCSPSSPSLPTFSHLPPVDVTTNKLILLLTNPSRPDLLLPLPDHHNDDHSESEYEVDSDSDLDYLPLPPPQPPTADIPSSPSPVPEQPHPTTSQSPISLAPRHRSRSPSDSSPHLHPRKRRRRHPLSPTPSQPRSQAHLSHHEPHARFEKELLSELTCEICFGLFWQPLTTPCQHTFCTRCLFRSLDHSQNCPLCRQTLPGYDYFQQHPCNKVILAIILKAFPGAYAERGATVEAEERDARLDTPLFVCQLSFPGMPTILHFFEPRYRLMLRRCLEAPTPCFGMIPPPRVAPSASANGTTNTGNDYGTMLQIRNVQMLPDGRSVVETWGTWRFRIMERGMRDGYMVARVERIEDYEEELDATAVAPEPNPSSESQRDPSSEPEAQSSSNRATVDRPGHRPNERLAAESRAEAERERVQLEAALRVEIGDVSPAMAPAVARDAAPTPSSSRSGASASAILPSPSSSASPEDRSAARPRGAGTPKEKQLNDGGASAAPPKRAPTNAELVAKCHAFIEQTRQGTPWVVQHLHNNYVPMPSDPASFSFWMALLLPIDDHEKAKLLPIRSPRLRLRLVVHWIEQLNSQWANAHASASALQVVLWRVRHLLRRLLLLPRAARVLVVLLAYAALLAAVHFGRTTHPARSGRENAGGIRQ